MRKTIGAGLALGLALAAGAAAAADAEIPAQIRGIWGAPSCTGDQRVAIILSHGRLEITGEGASYQAVETVEAAGEWVKLSREGAPASFLRGADTTLRVAVATVPPEAPAAPKAQKGPQQQQQRAAPKPRMPLAGPPAEKDPPDAWTFTDYARCPGLPSTLAVPHGEAVAVLAGLDQLRAACGSDAGSNHAACAAGLFKLADVSGNSELSIAELSRVGRVATYFATVMSGEVVPVIEILGGFAAAVAISPLLAKAIVSSFDYDDSGALSLAEMMQNRETLLEGAASQALSVAARPQIEGLIEQLKGAEQMLRLLVQ